MISKELDSPGIFSDSGRSIRHPGWNLGDGTVHVWRTNLNHQHSEAKDKVKYLSMEELERADRFHFEKHRNRFILSHAALRFILAEYLSAKDNRMDPGEIQFEIGPYGKPEIVGTSASRKAIKFNVSNSRELLFVGVTSNRHVGIDVEFIRPVSELDQIISSRFSDYERAWLNSKHSNSRLNAFFDCWCRKEAYLKAKGCGFSEPMTAFSLVSEFGGYRIYFFYLNESKKTTRWRLDGINIEVGYQAALAVENDFDHIEFFNWRFGKS